MLSTNVGLMVKNAFRLRRDVVHKEIEGKGKGEQGEGKMGRRSFFRKGRSGSLESSSEEAGMGE